MKLLLLDCDSTLSSIEGVDELARARGPEVFAACVALTEAAMEGKVVVEEIFGRRMEIIWPSLATAQTVARQYQETRLPGVAEALAELRAEGWTPIIVSGGFQPLIEPLAADLGIRRIEAVPLHFDAQGVYAGYGADFPTTRSGGKPEIVRQLRAELKPQVIVALGDGVSDLETRPEVDLFIGFYGVVRRAAVAAGAEAGINQFSELPALLRQRFG